ncbi:tRNA(m(1)G37)methyltransferase [Hypoxylon texense]
MSRTAGTHSKKIAVVELAVSYQKVTEADNPSPPRIQLVKLQGPALDMENGDPKRLIVGGIILMENLPS